MSQPPPSQDAPYLIVGLGNPGPRYARTRHNVGFMVVDELARRHGILFSKGQGNSEVGRGPIAGVPAILSKPLIYMNESGRAVGAVSRFYRVPIERILVVYDEIALPLGTIRLRERGSSAGHNGIKSLIQHLGTQNFPRLRVGVDQPDPGRHAQIDWVLGRFTSEEQKVLDETIPRAIEAIEAILRDGIERAMNNYNAKETKVPKLKASRPVAQAQAQESGIRSQESEVSEQQVESSVENPKSKIQNPKSESWVDRVRRIIKGEGDVS